MKRYYTLTAVFIGCASLLRADTNALIEVKLFKTWVVKGERYASIFNLTIKNKGTDPILLAKEAVYFESGQLAMRPLPHTTDRDTKQEEEYQMIIWDGDEFFSLLPEETHVYEGRKFFIVGETLDFSAEMRFTVSVYLGKGFWLDSETVTLYGVVPDLEEKVDTLTDVNGSRDLVAITYKNERWLYTKSPKGYYYEICPVSLTNRIRVEPHDGKTLYKVWDGDKSMTYQAGRSILTEGPDENDVFGKWTRERKRKADADNAEVRRRKADGKGK